MSDAGGRGEATAQFAAFYDKYVASLRGYVDRPDDAGLRSADELGGLAQRSDISMLQLVGMHLDIRRAVVIERGVEHLADMDAFLSAALSSFDTASQEDGAGEPLPARARFDWLRELSDAYIAVSSGATLGERVAEACVHARRFLSAADARLEFGRSARPSSEPRDGSVAGDEISADLLGGAGLLTVIAPAGRRWTDVERIALQQFAALIGAPINDARRIVFAERAGDLGMSVGGIATADEVVDHIEREGAERIGASTASVRLFDGRDHSEPSADVSTLADEVARSGAAVFQRDTADHAGPAWAALPINEGRSRLGVLVVGFDEPQAFDEIQRSFLTEVADRLGAALDRSRAYDRERAARADAELASHRLRELQVLATDLAKAATRRRVAQVLLRRSVVAAGADSGLIAIRTGSGVDVFAASGEFSGGAWSDLASALAVTTAATSGEPPAIREIKSFGHEVATPLAQAGIKQAMAQPITSGNRELGVLVLGWHDVVLDRAIDRALLEAQLAMAGSPLQRAARYDAEHTIADTLQRSLLAMPPIAMPGVRWSVLYRAGSHGVAGGDWYDLIELDDRRLAVVVGDIVGRGVEAAASMGQLRSATRALASQIADPGELLAALDRFAINTGQGRHSTIAYVVLDTRTGEARHAIAGHPPPVLIAPDGGATTLDSGRGPLLGVPSSRLTASTRLDRGASMVLYTDGLIERRGESIDVGIARLLKTVTDIGSESSEPFEPDSLTGSLVDRLVPGRTSETTTDDVAIVAVCRDSSPG